MQPDPETVSQAAAAFRAARAAIAEDPNDPIRKAAFLNARDHLAIVTSVVDEVTAQERVEQERIAAERHAERKALLDDYVASVAPVAFVASLSPELAEIEKLTAEMATVIMRIEAKRRALMTQANDMANLAHSTAEPEPRVDAVWFPTTAQGAVERTIKKALADGHFEFDLLRRWVT